MYKVRRTSDNQEYALKKVGHFISDSDSLSFFQQVKMGKLTEKERQNALNEVRILASIQ